MSRRIISLIVGGIFIAAALFFYDYSLMPDRQILVDQEAVEDAEAYGDSQSTPMMPAMPVIISEDREQHILYGDGRSGGHLHGTGTPCKSEFPESWNADKIIEVTREIAANDNLPWELQDNGYYVSESYEGEVRVRVVKGPQKRRVITAYPVNVKRNPCPY